MSSTLTDQTDGLGSVVAPPSPASPRANAASAHWPEPEKLIAALRAVSPFDLGLLPTALRPLVEDLTERLQVPADYPAATTLIALAVVCGRRAQIQPKVHDSDWKVVPNLWGGIVGPPGVLKSPVITSIMSPLQALEASWRQEFKSASLKYIRAEEEAKLNVEAWRKEYLRAKGRGIETPPMPDPSERARPKAERLMTADTTIEKLHELLGDNPGGISIVRDELTGFLASLERPGHDSDRTFYLEMWNGDSPYSMERIGRGSIHVEHCCVSIFGGIQPGRLRAYLADALRNGPTNDGLIQRFQIMVWPDIDPRWTYVDRRPNAAAKKAAEDVYRRIASLDPNRPLLFTFATDAQDLFVAWDTRLEIRLRSGNESDIMQAHLSKYRSLMPAIALLLSLADGAENVVDIEHARQAADWCEFLEQHARRVYSAQIKPEQLAAIALGRKLKTCLKKGERSITLRNICHQDWAGLGTAEEARAALQVLTSAEWVKPAQPTQRAGRPTELYLINPRIGESNAKD